MIKMIFKLFSEFFGINGEDNVEKIHKPNL